MADDHFSSFVKARVNPSDPVTHFMDAVAERTVRGARNLPRPRWRRRRRPWPLLKQPTSLWDPIPVMTDARGKTVSISLPYRSLLIGGVPGAGKSNALSMPLAVGANDPDVDLLLFDYKRVELGLWKACAKRFVGPDMSAAVAALEELMVIVEGRYEDMDREGVRKVSRGELRLILLVVDELMLYTTHPDKKAAGAFSELLRNAVAVGRAVGLIPIVCTQKPEGRVMDTNLRDLFAYQWALRCNTPQASDTILGQGRSGSGYDAASITPREEGVGFLAAEDGLPVRGQAFHLTDDHVNKLRARAVAARAEERSS